MEAYVYEPFPDRRSIRLFRLGSESEEDDLKLSLRTVNLDEQPTYCAISYTWNSDGDSTRTIQCEGKELRTNPGSRVVLEKIRAGRYRGEELWIDAICINQADHTEREAQVQLMRAIYSGAKTTLVYLGEPKEPGNLAIQLGEKIVEMTKKFEPQRQIKISQLRDHGLPPIESPEWRSLWDLFCQSWFRRVWIRQEYILSRDVRMLYGGIWKPSKFYVIIDETFNHTTYGLGEVLQTTRKVDASRLAAGDLNPWPENEAAIQQLSLMETTKEVIRAKLPWTMLSPFRRSVDVRATDPRDHIYGVLGLLDDIDAHDPDLRPNYKSDVSQTYAKAARFLLRRDGLEKFLQAAGYPRTITCLPSWVPDWTTTKLRTHIDLKPLSDKFRAGGGEDPIWKVNLECSPSLLTVRGIISADIDDVCHILDMKKESFVHDRVGFFWRTRAIVFRSQELCDPSNVLRPSELAELHVRVYSLIEPSAAVPVFFRSLGLIKRQSPVSESEKADLRLAVTQAGSSRPDVEDMIVSPSTPPPADFRAISKVLQPLYDDDDLRLRTNEEKENMAHYIAALELASAFLGFFVTKGGRVGRVPLETIKGDKVCYLQGISVPCIVRSHPELPGKYVYIGQCYVDGMMRGEGFQEDDLSVENIDLV